MDPQKIIRDFQENPGLDEGLRGAHRLLKAGEQEAAFDLLDIVYLNHPNTFPERVIEVSPEFHADVTETVEFKGARQSYNIVRREAQALEAIAQQANIRPRIYELSETGQTYELSLSHTKLGSILEELYRFPKLEALLLVDSQLTNLEGLPNLPQLKNLYLESNPLTTLEGMPYLPQLHILELRRTPDLHDPERMQLLRDRGVNVYT